jgi:uncharacterized protein with GYD domain
MARYLWHGSYSVNGISGVLKDGGAARVQAVEKLVGSVGGRLVSFDWAFGKDDFFIIVELPGNVEAAAVAMTVAATGSATVQTVPLISAADVDAAVKLHPEYRRPGG